MSKNVYIYLLLVQLNLSLEPRPWTICFYFALFLHLAQHLA